MKTPNELREEIVGKAAKDSDFRALLLADPKGALKQELGVTIPESLSVEVHEESNTTTHLVLPPDSKLNEDELQGVVGGALNWESVRNAMRDW